MRLRLAIASALALAGCLPTSATTVRSTNRSLAIVPSATGAIGLTAERAGDVVIVTALARRRCRGTVVEAVEIREHTSYGLVGTSNGSRWGYGLLVGMIVIYPVGIGAAVVSGVALLGTPARDQITKHSEVIAHVDRPCDLRAANTTLDVTWSSGRSTTSVTDDVGQLVLVLAPGEATPRIAARGVMFDEPPPSLPTPEPSRRVDEIVPAREPAVTTMTRTARARARAGDCELVKQIGAEVNLRDADYYRRVFLPATAPCR